MDSLIESRNLLNRSYFPRVVLPLAAVLSELLDLGIAAAVLFGLLLYYRIDPTWRVLWLPPLVLLAVVAALGAGLWLAALTTRFRDVRYAAPSLVRLWMFASPVVYPSSLVHRWRWVYELNPMAGVIDGFRWALTGASAPPGRPLAASLLSMSVLLVVGFLYFQTVEGEIADVI